MIIAKFINAKDIEKIFNDNGFPISYTKARRIKKQIRESHSEVILPDKNVIPLAWLEETYGDIAYKNRKKKGTSQPADN